MKLKYAFNLPSILEKYSPGFLHEPSIKHIKFSPQVPRFIPSPAFPFTLQMWLASEIQRDHGILSCKTRIAVKFLLRHTLSDKKLHVPWREKATTAAIAPTTTIPIIDTAKIFLCFEHPYMSFERVLSGLTEDIWGSVS